MQSLDSACHLLLIELLFGRLHELFLLLLLELILEQLSRMVEFLTYPENLTL